MDDPAASRWEWRIFSEKPLNRLAPLFKKLHRANAKKNRDLYVVSRLTDANLKIREGMLEIKIMLEASPCGAERWRPAFRCPFPPSQELFANISGYTGLSLPLEFEEGIIRPTDQLAVVEIEKSRDIYLVENTIIETGTARFEGHKLWSLCAESADLSQLQYFIRGCHMENEHTESYVTLLKKYLNW